MWFNVVVQAVALACVSRLAWRLFVWRFFRLYRSPLADVDGPAPSSLIAGNIPEMFDPDGFSWHHDSVKKYGGAFKVYGLFGRQRLYITDLQAIHHILIKEQAVCDASPVIIQADKIMFGDSLVSSVGGEHTRLRKMLAPAFSATSISDLFPIFERIARQLRDELASRIQNGAEEIDMRDWVSRSNLELMGQGALGHSFGLFSPHGMTEYITAVKELLPQVSRLAIFFRLIPTLAKIGSPKFRRFLWQLLPFKTTRRITRYVDILSLTATQIYHEKRRALEAGDDVLRHQVAGGKDILSILLKANAKAEAHDRMSDEEVISQMNALLFAANDTTSGAVSRVLHLLAKHPAKQARLRKELVDASGESGDLGYDALMNLPYLDAVVRETLRLYPPVSFTIRVTRAPIALPLSKPIISTRHERLHSLLLPADTDVFIGVRAVNRDPALWGAGAEEWLPERWLGKDVDQVVADKLPGVYSGILTFSAGSRSCIGIRFALLQIKIVVFFLLQSFIFEESSQEVVWKNGLFTYPATKGSPVGTPSLPLRLSNVI